MNSLLSLSNFIEIGTKRKKDKDENIYYAFKKRIYSHASPYKSKPPTFFSGNLLFIIKETVSLWIHTTFLWMSLFDKQDLRKYKLYIS